MMQQANTKRSLDFRSFNCGNCNKHVNTRYPVAKKKREKKNKTKSFMC